MKKLLLTAAAAIGFAAAAQAAPIYVVDDFLSSPPNPVNFTLSTAGTSQTDGPDTYTVGGLSFTRTVLFEHLSETDPNNIRSAQLVIMGGDLSIDNDSFVDSRTTLTYDISSLDALISNTGTANFGVIFSDGVAGANSTNIEAFVNGVSIGQWMLTQQIPGETPPEFAGFQFNGSMLDGSGDILQFVINGPAGYDLVVDQIAVIPEPGAIGLLGLGLAGLGFAARRRRG